MDRKYVLYLSNVVVPYRVHFFNDLSKYCDLTVLCERRKSSNRNEAWSNSTGIRYKIVFLDGFDIGRESSFSLRILSIIRKKWDVVVVGCYNTKVQMLTILAMRVLRIPFVINLDGEPFIDKSLKGYVKKFFLRGAKGYLTAGLMSEKSLKESLGSEKTFIHIGLVL